LKNGFTKSILKNTKKKSIFLKLKQTHPISMLINRESSTLMTLIDSILSKEDPPIQGMRHEHILLLT
jgi:hypothetical protein